jgi:hypothetical protein
MVPSERDNWRRNVRAAAPPSGCNDLRVKHHRTTAYCLSMISALTLGACPHWRLSAKETRRKTGSQALRVML